MSRTLRFGLVGCGRIGATADATVATWPTARWWLPYSHAAAIVAADGAELVAVCDTDREAALRAQALHHVPAAYVEPDEMFAKERLDVVAIATRTPVRMDVIRTAIRHGVRAFYCEKPLSQTLEDADEVARVAPHFVYGTKRRFMGAYSELRSRIAAGQLGTLHTVTLRFGAAPLFWTHPHTVDLATFLAGDSDVDFVQAELALDPVSVHGATIDQDPVVRFAHIRFRSGTSAIISTAGGLDVEAAGSKAIVTVRSNGALVTTRTPQDVDDTLFLSESSIAPPPCSGTVAGIESLVASLTSGRDPSYTAAHAVRNQEILFAMVESHLAGGARVPFPLRRRGLTITGRSGNLFA